MTIDKIEILSKAIKQSGVFVTSGGTQAPNIMAVHWCTFGTLWNKPVIVLPVRHSARTHSLIKESKNFCISIPIKDMRNEIIQCGHLSGHDVNKFEALNIHPKRPKVLSDYLVAECGHFLECKVIFSAEMDETSIDGEIMNDHYESGDFHTMFFAEVVAAYGIDDEE